jgi:small subunit ribosomal protein S17
MSEAAVAEAKSQRQVRVGIVVSDKMDKTIVVAVENRVMHDLYKRYMKRTKRFYAHDESGQCGVGDRVEIVSCRPLSRLKRWRLRRVLKKAEGS